ncbi:sulfite exporter TauE/SafE family protein [Gottfriedia acidiceleris]|uniref:Sulfite exporter TauE/SafE family protein n=1 Tax=Gottfriedia acidiceleris TaxID=371036 RepID=A0ABY4JQL8_9BACI|nr:sulfite exporter TauE/SafE family protein [Gottfriedia acidiceleris]UPM56126.1 sulfite exporter TauE/SafE family protein [Gottfriedia acidiceleris]
MTSWLYDLMNYLINVFYATKSIPIIAAFVLGVVGTLAPCQLTGNMGVIMIISNDTLKKTIPWKNMFKFILGKIVAFGVLGGLTWWFGRQFSSNIVFLFPYTRKLMGLTIILSGLLLLGFFNKQLAKILLYKPIFRFTAKSNYFIIGILFSLAFCPTMFSLFFFTLMPLSFTSIIGYLLPLLFAMGTAIPLLLFMFFIDTFNLQSYLLKKGRVVGGYVQKLFGYGLILLGLYDAYIYWL